MLLIIGGVIVYRWHKNNTEQYKTGIMEGGELCIAYSCADDAVSESFELDGGAVTESARFAFSEFSGKVKAGRIYSPVSEGKAVLLTSHSERHSEVIYEKFDITVDSGRKISFKQSVLTEEEYEAAMRGEPADDADSKQ